MKKYILSGLVISVCLVAIAVGCSKIVDEEKATEEAAGRAASQIIQLENTPSAMDSFKEPSAEIPTGRGAGIDAERAEESVGREAQEESMPVEPLGVGVQESQNEF